MPMVKTVGIVSLSNGTIGEDFVKHELDLGIDRLKNYGLKVKFMDHALKGMDYLKAHEYSNAIVHAFQKFRAPFS